MTPAMAAGRFGYIWTLEGIGRADFEIMENRKYAREGRLTIFQCSGCGELGHVVELRNGVRFIDSGNFRVGSEDRGTKGACVWQMSSRRHGRKIKLGHLP